MKHIKLNKNWNAEPNAPEPSISKTDDGIELTFLLNPLPFEHIDADDKGILAFSNIFAYRLGATNEEAYHQGQFRYKNDKLPWGAFYELIKSNWKGDFPDDKVILDDTIKKTKLRHFIFFFKDHIFECLTLDYQFTFVDTISEKLELIYPKGYFNHYLAMFTAHFDQFNANSYRMYSDLYIQMEGRKEFADLKQEIKNIKANKDLNSYLKIANYFEIENFGKKQLLEMIKVIETYKG